MGKYINIGNAGFQSAINGEYIDKTGLISLINGRHPGGFSRCGSKGR